ncbi:MAG: hypothetical protein HOE35_02060, partial [Candidatus Ruthia sp.]|nr:hypothetical protein [Candidatus Ruthturnera sp.]
MLINAGHPESTDSDGSRADIGAYPYLNSYSGPTWYITESGNDTIATGASDHPFRSIQAGINFSSDADSVTVAAGTYVENINFRGRNIKVVGEDRETTIIDGQQAGIVVDLPNVESSGYLIIKGFTIRNGYANGNMGNYGSFNQGAGIHVGHNYDPVYLSDLIIENCTAVSGGAGGFGGGIFSENSSLELSNVQINNNSAVEKGGGLFFWGKPNDESTLNIENSYINGNSSNDEGGGVYLAKSPYGATIPIVQLSNTTVSNNISLNNEGGGVYLNEVNATFENCIVSENTAANGAGINSISSTVTVNNSSISDNLTGGLGGAIAFWSTTTTLENVDITGNVASTSGGGLYFQNTNPIITDVNISNNSAYSGGGIFCEDQSDGTMTNVTISDNVSSWEGGGMYLNISDPTLTNVTITGNTATVDGGGMYLNQSNPTMTNVTVSGNTCENNGGGFFMKNNSNPSFSNSVLWNDLPQEIYMEGSGGGGPNNATISHTNIQGGQDSIVPNDNGTITWGNGNIDVDPKFIDAENDDYHLLASSQLINGGHSDSTDSDGTIADMGAYPYLNSYTGPTWHIAESGNDTTATGASDDPFRSIQSGINFSNDADSVTVAAGTYVENIDFRGKSIAIIGENRETTIIDGNQNGPVVDCYYIDNIYFTPILKSVTLMNGVGENFENGIMGGGVFARYSNPQLENVLITGCSNIAIYSYNPNTSDTTTIKNCVLSGNSASGNAGIVHFTQSHLKLVNTLISDNSGGGLFFDGTNNMSIHIINSTIINNVNDMGILLQGGTNKIINSIISGNESTQLRILNSCDLTVEYCEIDGGQDSVLVEGDAVLNWGNGNIDVDPMFVDTANGDYHLLADSRLIDAGHPDSTDADGTIADMGAYYYDQAGQPVRVSNLITTPSSNNVSVKWKSNSDAASYNIYRS